MEGIACALVTVNANKMENASDAYVEAENTKVILKPYDAVDATGSEIDSVYEDVIPRKATEKDDAVVVDFCL